MKTAMMQRLISVFTVILALFAFTLLAPATRAAGPMGTNDGWAINNDGTPILTPQRCALLSQSQVGWLRLEFRLVPGHTTWDSAMIGYYDTVVNNAHAAGIQIIGLIDYSSWPGSQTDWCANNYEHDGGNGSNTYTSNFTSGAAVPLISHFHDRIKIWEIWNEPNAWTSSPQPGYYQGGTYLYPSNYSQLLAGTYDTVVEYDNIRDVTLLFGGVFGNDISGNVSYSSSGAQYIDDTYNVGINGCGSFAYTHGRWGVYPLDGVAQHIYIDQGGTTSSSKFGQYLSWVRQAYTKYEGSGTGKKSFITEFGWSTQSVSQSVQDANLKTAFGVIESTSYLQTATWFQWQDNPAGGLYYGVLNSDGSAKTAYPDFQHWEEYQGYYSNGTVNTAIQNYFNSLGQSVLGNPFDNGGSPSVHHWAGGTHYAEVQDCNGGSHGMLTIFNDSIANAEVNSVHGLWGYYEAHGGISHYGVPKNNEYASGAGTRQDFESHYLTWDPTNGVVEH